MKPTLPPLDGAGFRVRLVYLSGPDADARVGRARGYPAPALNRAAAGADRARMGDTGEGTPDEVLTRADVDEVVRAAVVDALAASDAADDAEQAAEQAEGAAEVAELVAADVAESAPGTPEAADAAEAAEQATDAADDAHDAAEAAEAAASDGDATDAEHAAHEADEAAELASDALDDVFEADAAARADADDAGLDSGSGDVSESPATDADDAPAVEHWFYTPLSRLLGSRGR